MKMQYTLTGALAVCGLMLMAPAASAQKSDFSGNRLTSADSTFARKAAQGGMAEVKLGELAKSKASDQSVKDFAQRMIDDHTKAGDELKKVANEQNVTLPQSIDAKDQATYDRLSKLSGTAFDKAYMRDMVSDHRNDVNEFKHEADSGSNPGLKTFAGKTLPVLQQHLQLAESANAKVKNEQ